jgi:hypothetical protein
MKKGILAAIAIVMFVFIVTSCDRLEPVAQVVQPPQVVQTAPAPVIVQQSNDGFWQGLMLGHMFSSGPTIVHHYDSRPAYVTPRSTVVHNTTIVNKTVVQSSAPAPRPTYTAPRATSYSGSYSSRPSYSSYSSRSSYSSFSSSRR